MTGFLEKLQKNAIFQDCITFFQDVHGPHVSGYETGGGRRPPNTVPTPQYDSIADAILSSFEGSIHDLDSSSYKTDGLKGSRLETPGSENAAFFRNC